MSSLAPAEHSLSLDRLGPEDSSDRAGKLVPLACFMRELLAAELGEIVESRLAIVRRRSPFRRNPALRFKTLQRRIEGPMIHQEHVLGLLLYGARDSLSVFRAENERTQDEQVQRSLQQRDAGLLFSGEHSTRVCAGSGKLSTQGG